MYKFIYIRIYIYVYIYIYIYIYIVFKNQVTENWDKECKNGLSKICGGQPLKFFEMIWYF